MCLRMHFNAFCILMACCSWWCRCWTNYHLPSCPNQKLHWTLLTIYFCQLVFLFYFEWNFFLVLFLAIFLWTDFILFEVNQISFIIYKMKHCLRYYEFFSWFEKKNAQIIHWQNNNRSIIIDWIWLSRFLISSRLLWWWSWWWWWWWWCRCWYGVELLSHSSSYQSKGMI